MAKIPDDAEILTLPQLVPLNEGHDCSSFCCKVNELNDFLKNDALNDQEDMVSRTSLCYWNKNIVGFITLTADTIAVKTLNKGDEINDYLYPMYPAVKIARLAVDKSFEHKGFGAFMLLTAVGKVVSISNEIGCRYITVDSKPESIGFYKKYGFKLVEESQHKRFPKMYLNMYPILKKV